jgi:hypothetical protein
VSDHHPAGRWPRPALVAVCAGTCVGGLLLAGCGADGDPGAASTVTVTATAGTPSGMASAKPTATSDVKGRKFDVGTVSSVSNIGGSQVVELDRWTATGTSDSTLAEKGLKVLAHKGSRFTNQNTSKTYTAPVAPGARLVVNTCVADASGDLGMTSQPISASAWLAKPDRAAVLLVSYDSAGVIIRLDTDPRCPG